MAVPALGFNFFVAPNRRWWIAGMLFIATLLNYLDRQVLALVNPVLRKELSLTATGYSHILTAFLCGYTLGQLLVGRLIDRWGARLSLMIAMLWWSSAGLAAATSRSALQLSGFLFLMGLGEAAGWPASVKAIHDWFPTKERAVAVGFFNSGSCVGAVLAPIVVAIITIHYSWRHAFVVCGLFGFIWIIPWLFAYPPHRTPATANTIDANERDKRPPSLALLFRNRSTYGIVLGRFFCDSIWYFYLFWLPDFLSRVRHFSLIEIGQLVWIPFVAAGLGNIAGGWMSGWLLQRGVQPANSRLKVMAGAAVVMTGGIFVWFCQTPTQCIALVSLVVFAYSCWASNILTLPADLFPSGAVATIVGVSGTAAGLGGMITTLMMGRIIDRYSYLGAFVLLAILPLLASLSTFLSWRSRPVDALEA
jgi:ACS family hexuronate transporter-like MFS transporter